MREIARWRKKYGVAHGGARSGKTYAILATLIDYAQRHQFSRIAVVAKTAPSLRTSTWADFTRILRESGYARFFEISDFQMRAKYANGSVITFFGADDPQRVIGSAFDVIFFDEVDKTKKSVVDELVMRAVDRCFFAYNPRFRFWIEDFIKKHANETDFGVFNFEKNEAIPRANREYLEGLTPGSQAWKIYVKGEWGSAEGLAFSGWTRVDNVPPTATLERLGLDFGFDHPTALVAVYRDGDAWIFRDFIYTKNLTPSEIVRKTAEVVERENAQDVPIVCDGARPEIIAAMRDAGLLAKRANKDAGSVRRGVDEIRDLRDVRYFGDNIEHEYFAYEFDERAGQAKYKINDDALDAIRYAVDDAVAAQTKEREAAEAWSGVDLTNGFVDNQPF